MFGFSKSNVYELAPGGDFTPDPGADGVSGNADDINSIPAAEAFIVGRNFNSTSTSPFEGPAQDISIYTTFIQPK
jgi:hypothetical protein